MKDLKYWPFLTGIKRLLAGIFISISDKKNQNVDGMLNMTYNNNIPLNDARKIRYTTDF